MNAHIPRYISLLATSAIAAASLVACGGGGDDSSTATPTTLGTVGVAVMTDAPSCAYDAINVTVSKVRFHKDFSAAADASGWAEVTFSPAKKINLLNLASVLSGATTDLGDVSLPVGIYTQMRLVLDGNTSGTANTYKVTGGTTELPLETAVSLTNGFKMPVDLKIEDGKKASLVFDFDACNSIQNRGTVRVLKPRARALAATTGNIGGFIDKAILTSKVVVTAQQNGAIFATTIPNPTTGEFVLPRLPVGNFDVVATGNGRVAAVVGTVPVAAAATTAVSTATSTITMATSNAGVLSGRVIYTAPAVAPDDGTWIMAQQTVTANTSTTPGNPAVIVTYRFQPVDLATGAYTTDQLPVGALSFAPYKATLPLVFTAAASTPGTGKFLVNAVATGFSNKLTTTTPVTVTGNATGTGANAIADIALANP
ncbi:MAG: DUF4382 domain-containing protein [Massilia sp.]